MKKTNAMRLLDNAKIDYDTKEYEVDEDNLAGTHAAHMIGMPVEQVFKTLVTKGDKTGVTIFCLPVSEELDLKKAAFASKNKRIEMLPMKDILSITGYIRGGCSPIGMKKNFTTYIDETAILFDKIAVSAGARGFQIIINPQILCRFIEAQFTELC